MGPPLMPAPSTFSFPSSSAGPWESTAPPHTINPQRLVRDGERQEVDYVHEAERGKKRRLEDRSQLE